MKRNITTVVGEKTFVAEFHDKTGEFIEDFLKYKPDTAPENYTKNHDDQSKYIGAVAKIDVENVKLERIATILMPDKYGKELLDAQEEFEKTLEDDEEFPELLRMMGMGREYKSHKPELKEELAELRFTIVDQFPSPGGENMFFKVVRNDNPDIIIWMYSEAFVLVK